MRLPPGYALLDGPPAVDDYLRLRQVTAMHPKSPPQAERALRGSWSACHVTGPDGGTVAMGRVIGDGGWYFVVADMVTAPAHQRRGVGRAILDHLLADVRARAPQEPYVTLTADDAGRHLYAQAGFTAFGAGQTGMQLVLTR